MTELKPILIKQIAVVICSTMIFGHCSYSQVDELLDYKTEIITQQIIELVNVKYDHPFKGHLQERAIEFMPVQKSLVDSAFQKLEENYVFVQSVATDKGFNSDLAIVKENGDKTMFRCACEGFSAKNCELGSEENADTTLGNTEIFLNKSVKKKVLKQKPWTDYLGSPPLFMVTYISWNKKKMVVEVGFICSDQLENWKW
jgi:hypothetical protein